MLTKNDLSQIKTVVQKVIHPEIKALDMEIKTLKKNMATKDDLKGLEKSLRDDMKTGLKGLEIRLIEKIEESEMEIITAADKYKADKEDVKVLAERVDRLEENAGLPPFPTQ